MTQDTYVPGAIPSRVNPARMLADLDHLRTFGAVETGVVRPALSEADVASRTWLAGRFGDAGLCPVTDRYGNVFGRDAAHQSAILIGSHGDTQPRGGWLDGALGVIYGLEIARAAQEVSCARPVGIDAVSWNDEEGRFAHFLGCRAYTGQLPISEVAEAADPDGAALIDAIATAGYSALPERPVATSRHIAYFEGHIEQGPLLWVGGLQLAAVEAIVGAKEFNVVFRGEANHAGTTPMALRRDAMRAMVHFLALLEERFAALADNKVVWTFGRIEVTPNAPSIVPDSATISVQFRSPSSQMLDQFEQAMLSALRETIGKMRVFDHEVRQILDYTPTPMDARLTSIIARAADKVAPGRSRTMASGAGHDAQFMAPLMPSGMLFIPSIGGISHSFGEDTARDDIVAGCLALAWAVDTLMVEGIAR